MAPKLLPPELLYETVLFLNFDDVIPNVFASCRMLHDFLLPRVIKWAEMIEAFEAQNKAKDAKILSLETVNSTLEMEVHALKTKNTKFAQEYAKLKNRQKQPVGTVQRRPLVRDFSGSVLFRVYQYTSLLFWLTLAFILEFCRGDGDTTFSQQIERYLLPTTQLAHMKKGNATRVGPFTSETTFLKSDSLSPARQAQLLSRPSASTSQMADLIEENENEEE